MTATRSPDESRRAAEDLAAALPVNETPAATPLHTAPVLRVEHTAWLFVLLVAALFRFVALSAVPLSPFEGARALATWSVSQGRLSNGWPGGAVDAGTVLIFKLFGTGDAGARALSALAGLLLVASFWLLRPYIGRGAALLAALLAAISPVLVLDSRGVGGNALGAALTVLLAALVLRLLNTLRPRLVVAIVSVLSFGVATDAAFLGGVLVLALWLAVLAARDHPDVAATFLVVRRFDDWWRSAVPLGLAGVLLATSRFGTGFARLRPAALYSWAQAFSPSRPGVPWHYALDVFVGYELPIVVLAVAGGYLLLRDRRRTLQPAESLLLMWVVGGFVLNLFMAGRLASSLLLTLVPACLLAGIALSHAVRACAAWRPEPLDGLLAAGLLVAAVYFYVSALSFVNGTLPRPGPLSTLAGLALIALCLVGLAARWQQAGIASTAPSLAVLVGIAVFYALHGASALATGIDDEFVIGARTTPEAVAAARLLVANGGGVSTVTDDALPVLAWYVRDTVLSGGHGGARLIAPGTAVPAGFHVNGEPVVLARTWSPHSWSGIGMLRWWTERLAWGDALATRDVGAQLVVEDR